jgi:hypothetical protein
VLFSRLATPIPAMAQPQPLALRQVSRDNGFLYQPSAATLGSYRYYANTGTMYTQCTQRSGVAGDVGRWSTGRTTASSSIGKLSNNRVFKYLCTRLAPTS